ncbi:precorrin-6y C5,15-methyltransferase (decarboxylating) subunit CbiE [Intrasporangium sp. DVR]|uniref:precorrin-6y C5,15-methyltransferase (decarboxylating) subunit CbiE n=1 Tax=Intrasporangium sp. DVR TaxID=3127867 RepID=UPI00313A652A
MIEVVGVAAQGLASLTPEARAVLDGAEVVLGGARHLEMLDQRPGRELIPWPSPLRANLPAVLAMVAGRRIVVLASGDPLVSGVGATLVDLLGPDAVTIRPAVSSVSLARAEMRWGAEDSDVITLVGRRFDRLRRDLSPRARLIFLTHGDDAPARIATLLTEEGYGASRLTVLGDLGTPAQSRTEGIARSWDHGAVPRLHLVCVECIADAGSTSRSLTPGLDDAAFDNDGQLTKRIVRAAALAHLAPQPGDVMWDLGAGAGSVGIEFARRHPRIRVHAVERDPQRAARIRRNADRLGVPTLEVVVASAGDASGILPPPDAVFIGGGASGSLIRAAWSVLRPGGRMVVHGVTVETEMTLLAAYRLHGGVVSRIAVEDLEPIGSFTGWKPSRTITQWAATKPRPHPIPETEPETT